jgi:hypothetical protein
MRVVSIPLPILVGGLLLGAATCAPETDLTTLVPGGAGPPAGAPPGTLVDPIAGASDVPPNLAAVTVRFSAAVTLPVEALAVCGIPTGPVSPATLCEGGACYTAPLGASLPANVSCRVELAAGATDAGGQPISAGVIGAFVTSAEADQVPPVISGVSLQMTGPCVAITFSTDEVSTGTVVLRAGDVETSTAAGTGQTSFDVAVPFATLPPETAATVTVRAVDRAGNVAESAELSWQTPAALPPLVITEVLANSAGPEPAQEFVELRNVGADIISTDGLSIADARGSDALPPGTLAPGEYALVVTAAYAPDNGADPPPRAGTQLLRVDGRIGADGLSNGGEVTRLLRGDEIVSSYGGWVDVSSVAWAGRSVHRLVQSACDRRDAWNRSPLPPTPGADPP